MESVELPLPLVLTAMMVMMMIRMAKTMPPMISFIFRFSHHIFFFSLKKKEKSFVSG